MALKRIEFDASCHKQPVLLIGNPLETQEELAQLIKCVEPQRLSAVLYMQGQQIDGFFSRLASLKKIQEAVNRNVNPVDWLTTGTAYIEGMKGSLRIASIVIEPQTRKLPPEQVEKAIEFLCRQSDPSLLNRVVPVSWETPFRRYIYDREKCRITA